MSVKTIVSIFSSVHIWQKYMLMKIETVERVVTLVRGCRVILDCDVAALYGVETKRVNEAVKNNPEKFPSGYVLHLSVEESESLRSKFSTLKIPGRGRHSKYQQKAFTEKGLYMLATILKSPVATQTTLSVVETFARFRELTRDLSLMSQESDEIKRSNLLERSAGTVTELLNQGLEVNDVETTIEVNLAMLKIKRVVKRSK